MFARTQYDVMMNSSHDKLLIPPPRVPSHAFRTIGILGGMGPAATVDLMQKVIDATPASRDQEHVPMIVWNIPQIPDRNTFIAGGSISPSPAMCAGARALADAGAAAIVIACNTAHQWADEVAAAANRPLIHIADAALAQLQSAHIDNAMLLATNGTHQQGLYKKRAANFGVTLSEPDAICQADITAAIALVKAGNLASARETLMRALARLSAEGANTFILGCTELPLIVRGSPFEAKSMDATAALAAEIVKFSTGAAATSIDSTIKTASQKQELPIGDQVA
jgi:aspartate racemase